MANAREYGFYSNVNPRWITRAGARRPNARSAAGCFAKRQPTLMFNGYEDEVAGLYEGMDLSANSTDGVETMTELTSILTCPECGHHKGRDDADRRLPVLL